MPGIIGCILLGLIKNGPAKPYPPGKDSETQRIEFQGKLY